MSPLPEPGSLYDRAASRSASTVIATYSTSFGWATRLLAAGDREHIRNIYALVRVADEIVDDPGPRWSMRERAGMLDSLERETDQALRSGRSANLVAHAFARTARAYGIDSALTEPFFASMRADLSLREHDDASLARYIYGSAEVVGLMCLRVFVGGDDVRFGELEEGARRLGAAFQKVNFLRDLGQDSRALGRTYFPGLQPGVVSDADRIRILDDIDADLAVAATALAGLPPRPRRAVRAAHALFSALSVRLRATPSARLCSARVRVPDAVKAGILVRVLATSGLR